MGYQIDRLDNIMRGVLRVVWYRSLHMVSVPVMPGDILQYAQEHVAGESGALGNLGGSLEEVRWGPMFMAYRWTGIQLGKDLELNLFFFGFHRGAQTILLRERFWRFNFNAKTIRLAADPTGLVLDHDS